MNSLFSLSRKRVFALYFILMFTVIVGVNVATRMINNYYRDELIQQENIEFMEMFFHLMEYSDEEVALESAIHFSHINNISFKIFKNNELLLESKNEPSNRKIVYENLINGNKYVFEIDNEISNTIILRDDEVFLINILVYSVFSLILTYLLYSRRKRGLRTIHDIRLIQTLLDSKEECKNDFEFQEFHQIYHDVLRNIETIDLLMQQRVGNLNALVHDLKTPITILKYHLQNDDSIIENKEAIVKSLDDLTTIATDLIAEKFHGVHTKINASRIVEMEIKKYKQIFSTKNIYIDSEINDNLFINFNKRDLIRVLQNLLTNAYYYSFDDSTIKISLFSKDDYIALVITNEGEKISDSQIESIFNKKNELNNDEHSNGLGLHVTRLLLKDANASIFASSDEFGNHFKILFPKIHQ